MPSRECRNSRGRFVMMGGRLGERLTMVVAVCVPPGLPSSQTTVSWYEGVVPISKRQVSVWAGRYMPYTVDKDIRPEYKNNIN